jgi:hypothetical protein
MNNNRKGKTMVEISNITFKKIGTQIEGKYDRPTDVIAEVRFIMEDKYVCYGILYGRETFNYEGELSGYEEWFEWKGEKEEYHPPYQPITHLPIISSITDAYYEQQREEEVKEYEERQKKQKEEHEKRIKESKNPWKEIEIAGLKIKIAPLKDLQS